MIAKELEVTPQYGTSSLLLEPITEANVDAITQALLPAPRGVLKWVLPEDKKLLASPESYQQVVADPTQQAWAMRLGKKFIGLSHLWDVDSEEPGISTFITDPAHHRQGFGSISNVAIISEHAFNPEQNKRSVRTGVSGGNVAAISSLGGIGFYSYGHAVDNKGREVYQRVGLLRTFPILGLRVLNPNHPLEEDMLHRRSQLTFARRLNLLHIVSRG